MPNPGLKNRLLSTLLGSPAPLMGPGLSRLAARQLGRAAAAGDGGAARVLAAALPRSGDGKLRELILAQLEAADHPAARDALWELWRQQREPQLEGLLLRWGREASENCAYETRLYSSLKLGRTDFAARISPSRLPRLLEACQDPDPVVAQAAQTAASCLSGRQTIRALCLAWVAERSPRLTAMVRAGKYTAAEPPAVRVLTHLLQDPAGLQVDAAAVVPLLAALSDPLPEIARRAGYAIRQLQAQDAIDKLCALWAEQRDPTLDQILVDGGYTAAAPAELRLLTQLKTGQLGRIGASAPKRLPALLTLAQDGDPVIRQNARAVLGGLSRQDSREALCTLAIADPVPAGLGAAGQELAREIAAAAGYRPTDPEKCARFLFFSGSWEAYETLDFDQRLMRAIYETGSPELRQKIARQIQQAGRTNYLAILAGVDFRSPEASITAQEARILIQTLAAHQEWDRLWALTRALALPEIVEILRLLAAAGWQPREADETALFARLAGLAHDRLVIDRAELATLLPAALPLAVLKVSGRVNAVAFAPDRPQLAIGVSARKAALWDFQHGRIERLISGFAHSVGQVTFTPDGALVCGERTNTAAGCAVYAQQDGRLIRLGEHQGSLTGLVGTASGEVLSTGRDGRLVLWQLDGGRIRAETHLANRNWARGLTLAPGGSRAVLLYDGIQFAQLPGLQLSPSFSPLPIRAATPPAPVAPAQSGAPIQPGRAGRFGTPARRQDARARSRAGSRRDPSHRGQAGAPHQSGGGLRRGWENSMIRQAAFNADESRLVVGFNNGRVVGTPGLPERGRRYVYEDLVWTNAPVSGLQYIPGHDVLVATWASGEMDFLSSPTTATTATTVTGVTRRRSYAPVGRITSLHISPDGAFMATGSDEASLMLWDLRIHDIPELFQQPLSGMHPGILPGITALAASPNLDPAVKTGLQLLQILLEQRFQYDIQLDEIPRIQPGDYDIIIENGSSDELDQHPAAA